jgi:hypothetical protein
LDGGIYERGGLGEEERARQPRLFVGHCEDAIPAGRRLIEEKMLMTNDTQWRHQVRSNS